jgi:thymidylate kinase
MEVMQQVGSMVMAGWEGRTIYFIRHAQYPGSWTSEQAGIDVALLLAASRMVWGPMVLNELEAFASSVPTGREHFRDFERLVRVTFTFLFPEHLGEPRIQSRTEPGNESCEIRDVIFPNKSETGFWQDLKAKYSCTEIVIDAKNSMEITQDDLRQVYCYLKPAIGLWGFIVCRAPDIDTFQKYNRTLFKNFCQTRGVLLLSVCDLIAMARIRLHGNEPSEYLRSKMSKFLQSI